MRYLLFSGALALCLPVVGCGSDSEAGSDNNPGTGGTGGGGESPGGAGGAGSSGAAGDGGGGSGGGAPVDCDTCAWGCTDEQVCDDPVEVSVGTSGSCVRRASGQIVCWGQDLAMPQVHRPPTPQGIDDALALLPGAEYRSGCAIRPAGVECWRTVPSDNTLVFETVENTAGARDYDGFRCVVTAEGRVRCEHTTGVAEVEGLAEVQSLVGSDCALDGAGTLSCWHSRQPISGDPVELWKATPVSGLPPVSAAAGHSSAMCAVARDSGKIYCWGSNRLGELGDGDIELDVQRDEPTAISSLAGMTGIALGSYLFCAWNDAGKVSCWGYNTDGVIPGGESIRQRTPREADLEHPISTLAVGKSHACAIEDSGKVVCWGASNHSGQLGEPAQSPKVEVPGITGATAVSAGEHGTCAVAGGELHCWGRHHFAQVDVAETGSLVPERVSGLQDATDVAVGGWFGCVAHGGLVSCWGRNGWSTLGNGTSDEVPFGLASAVLPDDATAVIGVEAGEEVAAAIHDDGRITTWGRETGRHDPGPLPGYLPGAQGSIGLAFGDHQCVRKEAGVAACWGPNQRYQLGDEILVGPVSVPFVVDDLDEVEAVTVGEDHSCAIGAEARVYCWGDNSNWELGGATQDDRSFVPLLISGVQSAKSIDAGTGYTCAIDGDSDVWCWGFLGNLGAFIIPNPYPKRMASDAVDVSVGDTHACVARNDGSVVCWADDGRGASFGKLGGFMGPVTVPAP